MLIASHPQIQITPACRCCHALPASLIKSNGEDLQHFTLCIIIHQAQPFIEPPVCSHLQYLQYLRTISTQGGRMAGWAGSAGQRYKGLVIRLQCSDSGFTDTRDQTLQHTQYTQHSTCREEFTFLSPVKMLYEH